MALGRGQLDEALSAAHQAVSLLPDRAWPLQCLGDALAKRQDLEGAILAFHRAVMTEPARDYPRRRLDELVRLHDGSPRLVVALFAAFFQTFLTIGVGGLIGAELGVHEDLLGGGSAVMLLICLIGVPVLHVVAARARLEQVSPGVTALVGRIRSEASAARFRAPWKSREP